MAALLTVLVKGDYNRFHQRGCSSYCCEENIIMYPKLTNSNGVRIVDISSSARHHGIQTETLVSPKLFGEWIQSGTFSPERNIATLCHAFLYAVDLNVDESHSLEFSVPFFSKDVGLTMVSVRVRLIRYAIKEYILLELTSE